MKQVYSLLKYTSKTSREEVKGNIIKQKNYCFVSDKYSSKHSVLFLNSEA